GRILTLLPLARVAGAKRGERAGPGHPTPPFVARSQRRRRTAASSPLAPGETKRRREVPGKPTLRDGARNPCPPHLPAPRCLFLPHILTCSDIDAQGVEAGELLGGLGRLGDDGGELDGVGHAEGAGVLRGLHLGLHVRGGEAAAADERREGGDRGGRLQLRGLRGGERGAAGGRGWVPPPPLPPPPRPPRLPGRGGRPP